MAPSKRSFPRDSMTRSRKGSKKSTREVGNHPFTKDPEETDHEWTKFEEMSLLSLLVKYPQIIDPSEDEALEFAGKFNRAVNAEDISSDISVSAIIHKIEVILETKPA